MQNYTSIGNILQKYREEEKIGIRKQAEKLGISPSYLCDISKGSRKLTVHILKNIVKSYKYKCVGQDFLTLANSCYDSELIRRYKIRNHITDDIQVIKDLIFVITGENL